MPVSVWTSTLRRTIQTAELLPFPKLRWKVRANKVLFPLPFTMLAKAVWSVHNPSIPVLEPVLMRNNCAIVS